MTEQEAKPFVINRLMPALHLALAHHNLPLFLKHQGTCCEHGAIVTAFFLSTKLHDYEWQTFNGIFKTVQNGVPIVYNHSWVYGKPKSQDQRGIFIDASDRKEYRVFEQVWLNNYPHWIDRNRGKWVELKREQTDWKKKLSEIEYFSGILSRFLMLEVIGIAMSSESFDERWYEDIRPGTFQE